MTSSNDAIQKALTVLHEGGLVAIPTETVYGLAADADNEAAVMKIFAAKGRPSNHPLIVHVTGSEALPSWGQDLNDAVWALTDAFWPGPLTLVVKRQPRVGDWVTGGQDTVAVRAPSHPLCHALLKAFAGNHHRGLTAPSANSFGRISPTTPEHVARDLGNKVDFILADGPCEHGIESTIVDMTSPQPTILRHGVITRQMLEDVLKIPVLDAGENAPRASGRLKSHYAPRVPLKLVTPDELIDLDLSHMGVMCSPATKALLTGPVGACVETPTTPKAYGAQLYAAMHTLDEANVNAIYVETPPSTPEWVHILDRLGRAAA